MANTKVIEGKWTELRGKVKERWGKLTDDDLDRINGQYEQLVGLLEQRYGYAQEQAERETQEFMKLHNARKY
jgi:uncharacterized protein YjbJ (UPF0337 family)